MDQNGIQPPEESTSGLDPRVAASLCYLFAGLSGAGLLLVERRHSEVRFHAWQSVFMLLATVGYLFITKILGFVPLLNFILKIVNEFVLLGAVVLFAVAALKAFRGERLELPLITEMAQRQATFEQ